MVDAEVQMRLYVWRMKRGLTLQQASVRSGVALRTLSAAESVSGKISVTNLLRVLVAYDVTPVTFFGKVPKWSPPARPRGGRPAFRPQLGAT